MKDKIKYCVCPPLEAKSTYDGLPCDWCTNCGRKHKPLKN